MIQGIGSVNRSLKPDEMSAGFTNSTNRVFSPSIITWSRDKLSCLRVAVGVEFF